MAFPTLFPKASSFVRIQGTLGLPRSRRISFSSKLRPPQNETARRKAPTLPPSPPPSLTDVGNDAEEELVGNAVGGERAGGGLVKKVRRKVLSALSNLPLALGEMASGATLMALGTVIDQGEAPDFYFWKFPKDNPVLGFFTWRWVLTLSFDHMFSSPLFLGNLVLLGASLMACTYTTQMPLVKVSQRWNFLYSADAIKKQEFSDTLPDALLRDLGVILMGSGYEVFVKGPSLYAFKGLAGRIAPIGVHLALLLVMAGGTISAMGSFRGSVTVPLGFNFVIGDVFGPSGFLSTPLDSFNTEVHVNRFYMDFYDSGEVSQFYTDLSHNDLGGKELMRKTISVNDPFKIRRDYHIPDGLQFLGSGSSQRQ